MPVANEPKEVILERCITKLEKIIENKNIEKPSLQKFFEKVRLFEGMLITQEEYKQFEEQKEIFLENIRQIMGLIPVVD